MKFILVDENRPKIPATCKKTYIENKRRLLPVGVWCNVPNFKLLLQEELIDQQAIPARFFLIKIQSLLDPVT
ncbi:hypothetical protein YC2023_093410 [Brassica napus]